MSRIGNNPVAIPEGVTVEVKDNVITVKGKLGELTQSFDTVDVKVEEGNVLVTRSSDNKENKAKHGLYRSLVNNMVDGVSKGWTKELELVGVGYRASNQGQKLELALGFSHSIVMSLAPEIKLETISEKEQINEQYEILYNKYNKRFEHLDEFHLLDQEISHISLKIRFSDFTTLTKEIALDQNQSDELIKNKQLNSYAHLTLKKLFNELFKAHQKEIRLIGIGIKLKKKTHHQLAFDWESAS